MDTEEEIRHLDNRGRRFVAELNPWQQTWLALDCAVTGKPPERAVGQYHHYAKSLDAWLTGRTYPQWYLSDSGYSRVVWSQHNQNLFLTDNSTSVAKANWEKAKPQREAVEQMILRDSQQLESARKLRTVATSLILG